jgi:Protein of unknown function (DUF2971)
MSLYKYVTPDRIDILRDMQIRFTPPGLCNDPFEMLVVIEQMSNESVMRAFFEETRDSYLASLDELDEEMQGAFRRMAEEFAFLAENIRPFLKEAFFNTSYDYAGMLSLTEKYDNLLMWAHYAFYHQGFVIEFDEKLLSEYFVRRSLPWDEFKGLHKVQYSLERPYRKNSDALSFSDLYLVKSKEWEYEQEWRMVKLLREANRELHLPQEDVHLFSLPFECITAVILGCRMSPTRINEMASLLASNKQYSHIKVLRAILNERRFCLDIVPGEI